MLGGEWDRLHNILQTIRLPTRNVFMHGSDHSPRSHSPGRGNDMALYDLVFKGGGAKGMAFAGALQVFKDAGHDHRRVVGTSAGAITAMLTGAGYSPAELIAECTKTDAAGNPIFAAFMDPPVESDFTQDLI